jgi:predicted metal-dependent phosphoesterase TrpH
VEVSTTEGHLLVLGVREYIPQNLPYLETISIARQKGGVVIAAHPFKNGGIGYGARDADAVETFNSRCIFDENTKAKKIAQEHGKPEVGGSDSHLLATIGLAYTDIEAEPDEISILSAIREGRTGSSGHVVPLFVVFIHMLRGLLRKFRKPGKELYSRIFH